MKKLLIIIFLFASYASFGQGNWTLSGAKNRWANGIGFGNKDTSTYTNSSDTNLLVLAYAGKLCFRKQLTDPWQIISFNPSGGGSFLPISDTAAMLSAYTRLTRFQDSLTAIRGRINGGGVLSTSAQPNITSIGTLSNLTVTGNATINTISTTGITKSGGLSTQYFAANGTIQTVGNSSPFQELTPGNITTVTSGANLSVTGNINAGGITTNGSVTIGQNTSTKLTVTGGATVGNGLTTTGLIVSSGLTSTNGANLGGTIDNLLVRSAGTQQIPLRIEGNSTTNTYGLNIRNTATSINTTQISLGGDLTTVGSLSAADITATTKVSGVTLSASGSVITNNLSVTGIGTMGVLSTSAIYIFGNNILQTSGSSDLNINPYQYMSFGRNTNNTAFGMFVYKGDNTSNTSHYFRGVGDSYTSVNGNLAIGGTTVAAGYKTHTYGNATFDGFLAFNGTATFYGDRSSSTNFFRVNADGSLRGNFYGAGTATFGADGTISSISDGRLKYDKGTISKATPLIMKLKTGHYYKWKKESGMETEGRYFSLFANEVHDVLGEEFAPSQPKRNGKTYYGMADRALLSLDIQFDQEQQIEIEALKAENKKLWDKIAALEKRIK